MSTIRRLSVPFHDSEKKHNVATMIFSGKLIKFIDHFKNINEMFWKILGNDVKINGPLINFSPLLW